MEIIVSDGDGSYRRALALATLQTMASRISAPDQNNSGRRKARQKPELGLNICGVGCIFLSLRPPVNLPLRSKAQYQSNMALFPFSGSIQGCKREHAKLKHKQIIFTDQTLQSV